MTQQVVGLCKSEKKICTICNEPILKSEAIFRLSKKKQCHYCCSLGIEKGVGDILNQKDLKEIFYDFYRHHKLSLINKKK
jgi:hypothetical protein